MQRGAGNEMTKVARQLGEDNHNAGQWSHLLFVSVRKWEFMIFSIYDL